MSVIGYVSCMHISLKSALKYLHYLSQIEPLKQYLNRTAHLVYADRHKGVPTFQSYWKCGSADCVEHILKNCRAYCGKKNGKTNVHRNQVYELQRQHTREGYLAALEKMRRGFPVAAKYLDEHVDKSRVYLYELVKKGFTTHFHCTDNVAEVFNSVLT